MATQVQLRRGTAAQNDAFTGAVGEVTYDSDNDTLRVHDGGAAGGYELAKSNLQTHTNIDINSGTIDGTVIGGSTPAAGSFTTLNTSGAVVFNEAGADVDFRVETDTETHALFVDGSSNNVGIQVANPAASLEVSTSTADYRIQLTHTGGQNQIKSLDGDQSTYRGLFYDALSHVFQISGTERGQFDASGNLLVGATAYQGAGGSGAKGFYAGADGLLSSARVSASVAILNRTTSDGDIVEFRKDGTTVGSISARNGDLVIGTGDLGLKFVDSGNRIGPVNATTGADLNGTDDLGGASNRFKDLYLSGGVYLGGTGSANLLDDYEEGTFTATLESAGNTGATTLTSNVAKYTKIGDVVHIFCTVTGDANLSDAGDHFEIGGLPFTATAYGSSISPFNGVCHAGGSLTDNRVATGICSVFEGSTKIDVYTNVAAIGSALGGTICNLTVSYTTPA